MFQCFLMTDWASCSQILFMVGMGFLKPDLTNLTDCPKSMKKLITECISFKADLRPLFRQVRRDNVWFVSCSYSSRKK